MTTINWLLVAGLVLLPSACILFWVLYLAAVNLWAARDGLHWAVVLAALPVIGVMLAIDAAFNLTLATLLFWDRPRELLVTQRLLRYRQPARLPDRRTVVADFICDKALNPFDRSGRHC